MSKKFSKKTKSIVALVLAVVMVFGMSFAYFSDYAQTSTTGKAGTVAVSVDSNMNLLDADGKDIINPGDLRDAGFTVTNEGNKSIDVRSTIVLTTQSKNAGVDLAFSGTNTTQSEYDLYLRSDVEEVEGRGWAPKDGAQPLQVKAIDGDTITYQTPVYSLNGNSDRYDEVETIDGVNAFAQTNDYVLIMKGAAGNEWQNSIVSIDVLVEAKQHENTSAGWDIVAQENVATGAINQSAVKGENVITNGTVSTFIPVISKNENGEDLNASATLIEGQKKADLMNSLDEAGLANSEDVDLLIDVKADDFDGMADTTFDVSNVAEEGDTVVILHYDETKGEWEYIATDTVEDGKVGGDFSSYSPVAFIVIPATPDAEEPKDPVVPEEPETPKDIAVRVVDSNGNSVVGATVVTYNDDSQRIQATTDANGSATLTGFKCECPQGYAHGIAVVDENEVELCNSFNFQSDAYPTEEVTLVLYDKVAGIFVDSNGDPLANVKAVLFDGEGNEISFGETDMKGTVYFTQFYLSDVTGPFSYYLYQGAADNLGQEVEIASGKIGDTLPETFTVTTGTVDVETTPLLIKDPGGMPVEGAVVTVYMNWTTVMGDFVTDADGYAYIPSAYIAESGQSAYSCTVAHDGLGLTSGTAKISLGKWKVQQGITLQYQ